MMSQFYQRPIPSGAQDIGTWQSIFNIISVAAVITNAGLVCFTMDVLWRYSLFGRVWVFIGFQWVIIGCQFLSQLVIEDIPEEVTIQLQRNEFINLKVIEKVEDEGYGECVDSSVYEVTEEATENGGGSCCGRTGKNRQRKAREGLMEISPSEYPFSTSPSTWPVPLSEQNTTFSTAKPTAAPVADLNVYASNIAAVPNPVAAYH
jgi:hypothetical protein